MKGSVRKSRTDGGTWSYRIGAGLDDRGRRRREIGGFRTKNDTQTVLNEALADTQRGIYSPRRGRRYASSSTSGMRVPGPSWP